MSFITLSVKHNQTHDEARARLRQSVGEVNGKFPMMIQRVDWSPDGNQVKMIGKGFDVEMRVDAEKLHATGNITILGGLLAGPLAAGLKQILGRNFPKQLT